MADAGPTAQTAADQGNQARPIAVGVPGAVGRTPAESAAPGGRLARLRDLETFASLRRHPNFRLYWSGALASNIGTWMQMVAQGWLVYQLTESAFMLGMLGFASSVPILLFSLYGGVLADRFERRRLMVWTQTAMMLLAFVLAFLTFLGTVTVWHILAIALLNGTVNAFNAPVRQSIISDLVPRQDLQNAIALNSTQFQTSRTLGPAIAGMFLAALGPGWCFLVNALSFLAVIWTLIVMDLPPLPPRPRASALQSMREGLGYVRREPIIVALLTIAAVPSLFALSYQQMLPAFAESVLGAGAAGLGILQSAAGAGAVVGALTVASLGPGRRSGVLLLLTVGMLGLALNGFGLSTNFALSTLLLFVVGFAGMAYNALNQTFLQQHIADEMRGRVLGILTLITFGFQPFGAVQTGTLASFIGPQLALAVGGSLCVLATIWMAFRWPVLRTLR